jgi:prepilin-type N-terminal cleavage/methylation domain-containing protein
VLPRNDTVRQRSVGGFTLTEMLVALAVMVLALVMVTSVFSVTTKTAATSAAIADVETIARNFADQLQQDLEWCDPSQSILVIHGRTQAAALTEELRQAGQHYRVMTGDPQYVPADYDTRFDTNSAAVNGTAPRDQFSDPRADILMFFTNRPTASKAPATGTTLVPGSFQEKLQRGVEVEPIQVVYGHAALDTAVQTGSGWQFANDLRHIEQVDVNGLSELPASRWHLARRQVLFDVLSGAPYWLAFPNTAAPRIWRCYADPIAEQGLGADTVPFDLPRYMQEFQPRQGATGFTDLATLSPYLLALDGSYGTYSPAGDLYWANATREGYLITNVLYYGGASAYHHVATVIEHPPAALQDNLGMHLVPGCIWFQVEFLLPEDPRNGREHPLSDQRRDTPRWVAVEDGQTYVFVPDTSENRQLVEDQALAAPDNVDSLGGTRVETFKKLVPDDVDLSPYQGPDTVENRRVRMWPYAIRVTIRVIDQRGRLDEPIVRSVVHRFD